MKTKIVTINSNVYEIELRKFDTFNGTVIRFNWYKRLSSYCRNLTSKEWIRHLNN